MFVKQKLRSQGEYEELVSTLLNEIKHLQRYRQLTQNVEKAVEHRENVRALIHSYVAEYVSIALQTCLRACHACLCRHQSSCVRVCVRDVRVRPHAVTVCLYYLLGTSPTNSTAAHLWPPE